MKAVERAESAPTRVGAGVGQALRRAYPADAGEEIARVYPPDAACDCRFEALIARVEQIPFKTRKDPKQ